MELEIKGVEKIDGKEFNAVCDARDPCCSHEEDTGYASYHVLCNLNGIELGFLLCEKHYKRLKGGNE
jgi:hypothetical protein